MITVGVNSNSPRTAERMLNMSALMTNHAIPCACLDGFQRDPIEDGKPDSQIANWVRRWKGHCCCPRAATHISMRGKGHRIIEYAIASYDLRRVHLGSLTQRAVIICELTLTPQTSARTVPGIPHPSLPPAPTKIRADPSSERPREKPGRSQRET